MSKIAFISDIHGNLGALHCVLKNIQERAIDRVICLGDVASYNADQNDCMQLLVDSGIEWIAGNHDLIAAGFLDPIACSTSAYYSAIKARNKLDPKWVDHIRSLPLIIHNADFCAFHASPQKVDEYLSNKDRITRAASVMEKNKLPLLAFFGHTHKSIAYRVTNDGTEMIEADDFTLDDSSRYMVNVGTTGEPRDADTRATYTVFDTATRQVSRVHILYDYAENLQKSVDGKWRMPNSMLVKEITKARKLLLRIGNKLFRYQLCDSKLESIQQRTRNSI